MNHSRFIGRVDRFMSAADALREMTTRTSTRCLYGEFALRDILSEACISDWNFILEDGIKLVNRMISNIIRLPDYTSIASSVDYYEYIERDDNIHENLIKDVEFANSVMDKASIPYHFYVYEEDGVTKIRVRKDVGVV